MIKALVQARQGLLYLSVDERFPGAELDAVHLGWGGGTCVGSGGTGRNRSKVYGKEGEKDGPVSVGFAPRSGVCTESKSRVIDRRACRE